MFPPSINCSSNCSNQLQFDPSPQIKANYRERLPDAEPNYAATYYSHLGRVNLEEESIECTNARFFAIKSFSEANVHKSMKYQVWSSTQKGNQRLHEAYLQCEDAPLFLFYSVNESRRFVGVARMTSEVNFGARFPLWVQSGKWLGKFKVQWVFIKDVPNNEVKSILIPDNENKPITNVRDTQEIPFREGMMLLRKFKNYQHTTSMLDAFEYYDKEEKKISEAKANSKKYYFRKKRNTPLANFN
eukprot:TRINITY_DN4236_c0_g2_i5.p1 TRINITY_DN4236_c0_g2~~TRINITY_DN4236_c0_g2_i5.p1  ORF type:complete len:244 (+),score=52.92 TRINITY_DN4236_c0_g2_i5:232-963(+)